MEFIDSPTERTTAATDLLLAAVALACAAGVLPLRSANPHKAWLWAAGFALLGVAAFVGAVLHGFRWDKATRDLLWLPINLSLGLAVSLFVVAAVADAWGGEASRQALPFALAAAVAFFAATKFLPGGFVLFLVYEAVALLFALAVYAWLASAGRPGASFLVAGILLSIVAAAAQASGRVGFTLVWPFDHNGVFHLVQCVALPAMALGVRASLGGRFE